MYKPSMPRWTVSAEIPYHESADSCSSRYFSETTAVGNQTEVIFGGRVHLAVHCASLDDAKRRCIDVERIRPCYQNSTP